MPLCLKSHLTWIFLSISACTFLFLQHWSYKLKWEIVSFPFMKRQEPSSSSCGNNKQKAAPEFELCLCIDSSGNKWAEPKWQNKSFKFSEEVTSSSRRKEAGVLCVVEGMFHSFTLCCCWVCMYHWKWSLHFFCQFTEYCWQSVFYSGEHREKITQIRNKTILWKISSFLEPLRAW